MTDLEALFAAIHAHPEEDTPRLLLADYLDERAEGDDADRAEFIRVQINPHGCTPACSHEYGHLSPCTSGRADAILARNPGWLTWPWLTWPCQACGGRGSQSSYGHENPYPRKPCQTCGGTGDLFQATVPLPESHPHITGDLRSSRTITHDRGFTIVHATAVECWREDRADWLSAAGRSPYVPTPWLRDVLANPWVVGVRMTDYPPVLHETNRWAWTVADTHTMPRAICEAAELRSYPTADAANLALAYDVVQWGRKAPVTA